jgi:hypothetical protein
MLVKDFSFLTKSAQTLVITDLHQFTTLNYAYMHEILAFNRVS